MKRIVQAAFALILAFNFSLLTSQAQPQKTRVQTTTSRNANATRTTGTNRNAAGKQGDPKVSRASIMFPTAVAVPEEVPWRRDVYRSLDLTKDENAALYYPVEPQGNDVNLFTLLFRLLNTGTIPAYEYKLDGVEDFSQANRMHFKDMLDRFSIFYEIDGRSIKVADADVPSSEVLSIYVKESSYYDQNTATYHSRVVALCPVLHRADDFSMDQRKYPMFWVKIEDIEPYLSQRMVMTSNLNNAARMSMADFFATNHYKGDIYMTTNMQGKSLQDQVNARQQQQIEEEYVDSAALRQTTALQNEQKRIEKQLSDFEQHIWATPIDSAEQARKDSIAALNTKAGRRARAKAEKTTEKASRSARRSAAKEQKQKSSGGSDGGGSAARVSVRRQRH